jgi:hypothetical protein
MGWSKDQTRTICILSSLVDHMCGLFLFNSFYLLSGWLLFDYLLRFSLMLINIHSKLVIVIFCE